MIPDSDLEVLRSFNGRGNTTLSAYLRLDSHDLRQSAYNEFMTRVETQLDACDSPQECREALKEDMEIVGLYLRTNGHRAHPAVAIFSCATELFWRVYPLPKAVPFFISVGPRFDLEPLEQTTPQAR